ncbi:MAG: hypothetical protein ACUVXG_02720 [Anaerolineae bacterium]
MDTITVAKEIPTPPPTATPTTGVPYRSQFVVGDLVEKDRWDFKVYEVKKRKAVYFYDSAYVAQGHFLIVLIEATNRQPGTSYFCTLVPYVIDRTTSAWVDQRGMYKYSSKATWYAAWQFGGLDSCYTDVSPNQTTRLVLVYDCPSSVGDLLLSLNPPVWVYLGNFAAMQSED